jgi:hypothetical protein
LRREPYRREHDRKDDKDLAPEDLGRSQVCPRCTQQRRLKRPRPVCEQPGNRGHRNFG